MTANPPLTAAECAERLRERASGILNDPTWQPPSRVAMGIAELFNAAASHLDRLAAVERDAREGDCAQLRMLLDRARQKNAELNRRCQSAESGLTAKVLAAGPGSFGRAFANSAASMYKAKLDEATLEIARLRAATPSSDERRKGENAL